MREDLTPEQETALNEPEQGAELNPEHELREPEQELNSCALEVETEAISRIATKATAPKIVGFMVFLLEREAIGVVD